MAPFRMIVALSLVALGLAAGIHAGAEERKAVFVGSETCQGCHEAEYKNFSVNAKKAHSYDSILRMQKKLAPAEFQGCFKCHTTGYGQAGGFTSVDETPQLRNAGCEVCHGPGSLHAESGDPADLTEKVTMDLCNRCHQSDRVAAFRFKPMLFAGAH